MQRRHAKPALDRSVVDEDAAAAVRSDVDAGGAQQVDVRDTAALTMKTLSPAAVHSRMRVREERDLAVEMLDRRRFEDERFESRWDPRLRRLASRFRREATSVAYAAIVLARLVQRRSAQRGALEQSRVGALVGRQRMALARAFVVERLRDGADRRRLVITTIAARTAGNRRSSVARRRVDPRRDREAIDDVAAALRFDRELAHRLDAVAEEVDAHRRVGGRGKEVDDAAAHRVLADGAHDVAALVAELEEAVAARSPSRPRRRSAARNASHRSAGAA